MAENSLEQFRRLGGEGGPRGLRRKRKGWQNWLLKAKMAEKEGRGNLEETHTPLSLTLKGSWVKL